MTTATATTWPTEASLEPAAKALSKAFNATESVGWPLDRVVEAWMDEGKRPDSPPTLETVGALYSFLETLRSEIGALTGEAERLGQLLREIDTMRLDIRKADDA